MLSHRLALGELWSRVIKYFPEHQIYLRTNGKVRFLTLPSGIQLGLCTLALMMVGWMTLATWNYFHENIRLAAKEEKLDEMRGHIEALSTDLDVLQRDIIEQAESLEARQSLLQTVLEQGLAEGLVDLDLIKSEAPQAADTPPAEEAEKERSAALDAPDAGPGQLARLYQRRYDQIADSQQTIAEMLLGLAQMEFSTVEDTLASLNLSMTHFLDSDGDPRNNVGGPFIPAALHDFSFNGQHGESGPIEQLLDEWQQLLYIRHAMLSVPALVPVDHYFVSSNFGKRRDPMTKHWAVHSGIDLAAWYGTKVKAATDGVATRAGYMAGYGRMVEIDHGNGFKTRYGHLRKVLVKKGQKIAIGDIIGESGNTGRSTGPHLHYEVWFNGKPVDPKPYIEASDHVLKIQRRPSASNG